MPFLFVAGSLLFSFEVEGWWCHQGQADSAFGGIFRWRIAFPSMMETPFTRLILLIEILRLRFGNTLCRFSVVQGFFVLVCL